MEKKEKDWVTGTRVEEVVLTNCNAARGERSMVCMGGWLHPIHPWHGLK